MVSREDIEMLVGMKARLWDFMPSHDHLAIRLSRGDDTQYLVLSGCNELSTPVFWQIADPSILPLRDGMFELRDAGVRITFQDSALQSTYSRSS